VDSIPKIFAGSAEDVAKLLSRLGMAGVVQRYLNVEPLDPESL